MKKGDQTAVLQSVLVEQVREGIDDEGVLPMPSIYVLEGHDFLQSSARCIREDLGTQPH